MTDEAERLLEEIGSLFGDAGKSDGTALERQLGVVLELSQRIFVDRRVEKAVRANPPGWYRLLLASGKPMEVIAVGLRSRQQLARCCREGVHCLLVHEAGWLADRIVRSLPRDVLSSCRRSGFFTMLIPSTAAACLTRQAGEGSGSAARTQRSAART